MNPSTWQADHSTTAAVPSSAALIWISVDAGAGAAVGSGWAVGAGASVTFGSEASSVLAGSSTPAVLSGCSATPGLSVGSLMATPPLPAESFAGLLVRGPTAAPKA